MALSLSAASVTSVAAPPLAIAEPLDRHRILPRPSVVILWATWCASCKAELDRLENLRPAADPLPIATLAIDPPDRARAQMVADRRRLDLAFADRRPPASVLADWGGKGAMLPLAVAIDRAGRVCGMKHGLLGTDQLRQWGPICSK